MEVSLRPMGGLRETASPFDPALWRMVFLQSFTSAEGKRRNTNGNTSDSKKQRTSCRTFAEITRINTFRLRISDVHRPFVSTKDILTDRK